MLLLSSDDLFSKLTFFSKYIFHEHYQSVKRFGSGSKLFAQGYQQTTKVAATCSKEGVNLNVGHMGGQIYEACFFREYT